jgi:hypothetical protein
MATPPTARAPGHVTTDTTDPYTAIRRALRRYRILAQANRYGGLATDYQLALSALDALDRITNPQQPRLL